MPKPTGFARIKILPGGHMSKTLNTPEHRATKLEKTAAILAGVIPFAYLLFIWFWPNLSIATDVAKIMYCSMFLISTLTTLIFSYNLFFGGTKGIATAKTLLVAIKSFYGITVAFIAALALSTSDNNDDLQYAFILALLACVVVSPAFFTLTHVVNLHEQKESN